MASMTASELALEGSKFLTRNLEMAAGQGEEEDTMSSMTDPLQLMALGASYKKEGRFQKAVEAYGRVCETDKKNPDAPVQLAMCLMHTGEMDRADTTFQKALEFYDNVSKPELWHALGQLYALEEKATQSEESLNQVIETEALAADVHFRLSALACAALNYDKAIDHLKRAASAVSSDDNAMPSSADIWFELGDVYSLKGGCSAEAAEAFENSGRSENNHSSWHIHGAMLDKLVGFNGKGGALRRKALRAMVRSVEMAQDQPQYWHTLAVLHRKMGNYEEAFDSLEHFARMSVAIGEQASAETEALRISLQESGESQIMLAEENSRVREAFEAEKTANTETYALREAHEQEQKEKQRLVQSLNKEIEKYKGWLAKFREENRFMKGDVEKAQRQTREAEERTDKIKKEEIPELKREIANLRKGMKEKQRQIAEMLGVGKNGAGGDVDMTPLEKVAEMEEKCQRYEMLKDEAEKAAVDAKRDANTLIKEVQAHSKLTQDELNKTTSRLAVCEKKLSSTRQELAMLKGTPDGEAFAAAEQYKEEVTKAKEIADVRKKEAITAKEHEQLAHTQANMIEGQLRDEIAKLKESRARLATRVQLMEERNADDHEELRKIKARDAHWEEKSSRLERVVEQERIEIDRWKDQYNIIKNSIDGAASTAVAKEAMKVVSVMDSIDNAANAFEGFLDGVLSQGEAHLTHHTTAGAQDTSATSNNSSSAGTGQALEDRSRGGGAGAAASTAIVPMGVAVEMGVQCDGVYSELEEDTQRLNGMDAAMMLQRCEQSQTSVHILMEDARNTINACRAREATLHEEAYQSDVREKDLRKNLKKAKAEIVALKEEMEEVIRDAEERVEQENEIRKFTEWKMRAKTQEHQRRIERKMENSRKGTLQFQQDKMAEMLLGGGGGGGGRPQSAGPMGGSAMGNRSRPHSAQAIIQSLGAQGADRYLHPKPLARTRSAGASRHHGPGGRQQERPSSAASFAGYGLADRPGSAAQGGGGGAGGSKQAPMRFDRHQAFYGNYGADNQVDLQASVDRLNMSGANVSNVMAGLDQLKTKGGGRGSRSGNSSSSNVSGMFDPRTLVSH